MKDKTAWVSEINDIMESRLLPCIREREALTVFTSANVGYGTNHLAVELSALCAYIAAANDFDKAAVEADAAAGREAFL